MKRTLFYLIVLFTPLFCGAQIQLGDDIDGQSSGDWSGYSVSLSSNGDIMAVGSIYNDENGSNSGQTRVYQLDDTDTWLQLGANINGDDLNHRSGYSISLSSDGDIIAIGTPGDPGVDGGVTGAGYVRIYKINDSDVWEQLGADITGEIDGDQNGHSVSLSSNGQNVAIGAIRNNEVGTNVGHARVFQLTDAEEWTQIGGDIDGMTSNEFFGTSVSLSNDATTLAVSAPNNDDNGVNSGLVRVYELDDTENWIQLGADLNGDGDNDKFGWALSLSENGNTLAIGAIEDFGGDPGYVKVYELDDSDNWIELGSKINGESTLDQAGYSVSLSGNGKVLAIGAHLNDGNGSSSGHVRVYAIDETDNWLMIGLDIDGEIALDESGKSVYLTHNGTRLAIGATRNDGNGSNAGHVRVYDLSDIVEIDGTGINQNLLTNQITIYPNPAINKITVSTFLEVTNIELYNLQGKLIQSSATNIMDISNLETGVYSIKITTELGQVTKQLVKK